MLAALTTIDFGALCWRFDDRFPRPITLENLSLGLPEAIVQGRFECTVENLSIIA